MADGTARIGRRQWLTPAGGLVDSGLLGARGLPAGGAPASETIMVPVRRGDVEATISASGSVVARADTTLNVAQTGASRRTSAAPAHRARRWGTGAAERRQRHQARQAPTDPLPGS